LSKLLRGLISLTGLAAKLLEGLELSCLPKNTPLTSLNSEFHNNNNHYYRVYLSKLGRKLADQSGDDREISFLFQRLSVLIQRYNAILLHDCFVKEEEE